MDNHTFNFTIDNYTYNFPIYNYTCNFPVHNYTYKFPIGNYTYNFLIDNYTLTTILPITGSGSRSFPSGLIWVQIVWQGYQQTTLVSKEFMTTI